MGPKAAIAPLAGGLINQTFLLTDGGTRLILQRVNPLFSAAIHQNIHAVTTALTRAGMTTPVLLPTCDGQHCLELPAAYGDGAGVWRLMTYVDGASFDVVTGASQARAAGALVARFHTALDGMEHIFVGLRASVHDTARHLEHLRNSVASRSDHRLFPAVSSLAVEILQSAQTLPALPTLPPRICHGDLKFNNLLFAGAASPLREQALCLIDLDTVGPMALAFEMGDAWRSWCNRNGEDNAQAALDLEVYESSLDGYREGLGRPLSAEERQALLLGPEWISLELGARFAADALIETYFGWDSENFAGRGEHNLVRARGQFSLYRALANSRPLRARLLAPSALCGVS